MLVHECLKEKTFKRVRSVDSWFLRSGQKRDNKRHCMWQKNNREARGIKGSSCVMHPVHALHLHSHSNFFEEHTNWYRCRISTLNLKIALKMEIVPF